MGSGIAVRAAEHFKKMREQKPVTGGAGKKKAPAKKVPKAKETKPVTGGVGKAPAKSGDKAGSKKQADKTLLGV